MPVCKLLATLIFVTPRNPKSNVNIRSRNIFVKLSTYMYSQGRFFLYLFTYNTDTTSVASLPSRYKHIIVLFNKNIRTESFFLLHRNNFTFNKIFQLTTSRLLFLRLYVTRWRFRYLVKLFVSIDFIEYHNSVVVKVSGL